MGFFLETLFGGLMAGMLYSLIALGFVLIYKASGVFNFAQGAMVLFAALAMARFAEWIPHWTGLESKALVNLFAFLIACGVMVVVAWLIEKLALGKLVKDTAPMARQTAHQSTSYDEFALPNTGDEIHRFDLRVGGADSPVATLAPDLAQLEDPGEIRGLEVGRPGVGHVVVGPGDPDQ